MAEFNENELNEVAGGVSYGPYFEYTVKSGDCLSVIAQRFGVKLNELIVLNHIVNPDLIRVNQKLLIPRK